MFQITLPSVILIASVHSAAAEVVVSFRDGNPYDRLQISNLGCGPISGPVVFDLRGSVGQVLIDTMRGGPGTKDPMPVEVERGDITLPAIPDGARDLTLTLGGLAAGDVAVVTLDLDDTRGWWPGPRVEVFEEEIAGATVTMGKATATFGVDGIARLEGRPCDAAPEPLPRQDAEPIARAPSNSARAERI